jgi:GH25 family lysozyme M1 (1,4-beta-N-acetylmuramidase)
VSGKSGSWYRVTCGNKTGYVKAQYIKKGNPPVASVAPAPTPQPAASDNTTHDQNQTTQPAPVSQPVQLDYSPVANFTAYIGYDQLKVYQNSDTTSSVVATMREKSAVLVIGTKIVGNTNWSRIRLSNSKEGYVKTANLETDINKFNAPTSNILGYGLDISHYQNEAGPINYDTIASGYNFITIKATEGTTWKDTYFKDNVTGALATKKLKVSYYHYFHATDVPTAQSEAEWFMKALDEAGVHGDNSGYVFIDVEENGGNSQLTESVLAFLEKLRANGFTKLGIYTGMSYLTIQPKHSQPYIDVDYIKNSLTANAQQNNQQLSKILIWLSRYRGKDSYYGPGLDNVDIWQYTSNGIVAGVNGAVDKDVSYFDPNGM